MPHALPVSYRSSEPPRAGGESWRSTMNLSCSEIVKGSFELAWVRGAHVAHKRQRGCGLLRANTGGTSTWCCSIFLMPHMTGDLVSRMPEAGEPGCVDDPPDRLRGQRGGEDA